MYTGIYTHAHTNTHTHAYTHAHTYTQACTYMHPPHPHSTHMHTHIRTHIHIHTHTHTHIHTHTHTHTHTPTHTQTHRGHKEKIVAFLSLISQIANRNQDIYTKQYKDQDMCNHMKGWLHVDRWNPNLNTAHNII